jgi:hypothetical protein
MHLGIDINNNASPARHVGRPFLRRSAVLRQYFLISVIGYISFFFPRPTALRSAVLRQYLCFFNSKSAFVAVKQVNCVLFVPVKQVDCVPGPRGPPAIRRRHWPLSDIYFFNYYYLLFLKNFVTSVFVQHWPLCQAERTSICTCVPEIFVLLYQYIT